MNAPEIGKEHPILFSGEMVWAILEGRKSQTRRVIKGFGNTPHYGKLLGEWALSKEPHRWDGKEDIWRWQGKNPPCPGDWIWRLQSDVDDYFTWPLICPYGCIGDRLWVRETWFNPDYQNDGRISEPTYYRATDDPDEWPWRPSIHMPRWASRIDLEITDVRVERVQEITDYDCCMEGIPVQSVDGAELKDDFSGLWDSINAKRGYGWEINPWIWVLTFKRIRP